MGIHSPLIKIAQRAKNSCSVHTSQFLCSQCLVSCCFWPIRKMLDIFHRYCWPRPFPTTVGLLKLSYSCFFPFWLYSTTYTSVRFSYFIQALYLLTGALYSAEHEEILHESYHIYCSVQIFMQMSDVCFSKFLVPGGLLLILVIIIGCNYVCIKLYHQFQMPAFTAFPTFSILCLLFLLTTIQLAGDIHSNSLNLIDCIRRTGLRMSNKIIVYHMKSCRVLRSNFHIFFYFQRVTIIGVISFSIFYTVKAALIF